MNTKPLILLGVFVVLGAGSAVMLAEEPTQQQIFGYQLMTEQERQTHRRQMRALQSEQERQAYRLEHHQRMLERAREQGVDLPDRPLEQNSGTGRMSSYGTDSKPGNRQGRGQGVSGRQGQ